MLEEDLTHVFSHVKIGNIHCVANIGIFHHKKAELRILLQQSVTDINVQPSKQYILLPFLVLKSAVSI